MTTKNEETAREIRETLKKHHGIVLGDTEFAVSMIDLAYVKALNARDAEIAAAEARGYLRGRDDVERDAMIFLAAIALQSGDIIVTTKSLVEADPSRLVQSTDEAGDVHLGLRALKASKP